MASGRCRGSTPEPTPPLPSPLPLPPPCSPAATLWAGYLLWQIEALLGPKTEADLVKPEKKKPAKAPKEKKAPVEAGAKAAEGAAADEAWRTADPYAFLPKPAENNKVRPAVLLPVSNAQIRRQVSWAPSPHAFREQQGARGGQAGVGVAGLLAAQRQQRHGSSVRGGPRAGRGRPGSLSWPAWRRDRRARL
jgi:hypothetical protein